MMRSEKFLKSVNKMSTANCSCIYKPTPTYIPTYVHTSTYNVRIMHVPCIQYFMENTVATTSPRQCKSKLEEHPQSWSLQYLHTYVLSICSRGSKCQVPKFKEGVAHSYT